VDLNTGGLNESDLSGAWYSVGGVEDRVIVKVGPFMLYGVADNLGFDLDEKDADEVRRLGTRTSSRRLGGLGRWSQNPAGRNLGANTGGRQLLGLERRLSGSDGRVFV